MNINKKRIYFNTTIIKIMHVHMLYWLVGIWAIVQISFGIQKKYLIKTDPLKAPLLRYLPQLKTSIESRYKSRPNNLYRLIYLYCFKHVTKV